MNVNYLRMVWFALALGIMISAAPAVAAPDSKVNALLESSRAALGAAAIDRIKYLKLDGTINFSGLTGTGTSWSEMRGMRFAESYSAPPIVGADGYDGNGAWNQGQAGFVWVDGGVAGRSSEINIAFVSNYALWARNHGGANVKWGGMKTASRRAYDVLVVTPPGSSLPFELWFDRSTHLPVRLVQVVGTIVSTSVYNDFRTVNGLKIPFHVRTESGDGNTSETIFTRVLMDPPGAAAHLVKPASTNHDFSIAGGTQTIVPIELAENHVYLSVMLNGKGPYRFIYDTGGSNLVDPAVAKEIGALGRGSAQGGGVGAATESFSFAMVGSLRVGDALIEHQLFSVVPTRQGFGVSAGQLVDGVIGFEVLARFITTFDYANNRVVLQMPQGFTPPGVSSIPFVFFGTQPQFACAVDGIAAQCALDTGARNSISFMSPFSAGHPQIVPKILSAIGVNGFGIGGAAMGRLGRLQSLQIGKFTLRNLIADFTAQKRGAFTVPFVAANVGGSVWKRFSLTLDYYTQRLYLEPNASFSAPDTYDRSGLFLISRSGKYVVFDARPGTVGAQAGIAKGDTLDSVDGKTASGLSLAAVRLLLAQPAGTVVQLGITSKAGLTRQVRLTLRDYV
jgi:hypothetical protein